MGNLQAKRIAQRFARIFSAEQSTLLQNRHDEIDKVRDPAKHMAAQYGEPIRSTMAEPILQLIGYVSWRPYQRPVMLSSCRAHRSLPKGQAFSARNLQITSHPANPNSVRWYVRERPIEVEAGEIDAA